ncbi:MAG: putative peptidoglycan lipid II flippase MurJ, partial [Candidatus Levybacteria bacterium GW2011_GWA2_36_13]
FSFKTVGISSVSRLMWPRTLSIVVFQIGTIITLSLISFIPQSGRNYVIFDYAQTLAFAPIVLFGQTIAQAAFPILSRERHNLSDFRQTFLTSFNQTLYLVLPVSAILLILRIPVVRLIYGAGQFDWQATVLTGRTLGFFTLSIFAQALSYLAYRGFYALHDTKTPLIIGSITTGIMLLLSALFVLSWEPFFDKLAYNYQDSIRLIPTGVETIALAFSITSILNIALLMFFLNRRVGGIFNKELFFLPQLKILISAFAMGFALYIPIKLLDQLVFDTTRTINLLLLTGISSIAGFSLYLFLTWFFNVKEASTFLLLFRHLGNWREILGKSQSIIETKP